MVNTSKVKEIHKCFSQEFDVAIIGGGPSGSAAATVLSMKGYSVAIIERSNYSRFKIGETLPPKVNPILNNLGIGEVQMQIHIPSFANSSSWDSASLTENNFLYHPFGNGWHLDRNTFDREMIGNSISSGSHLFMETNINSLSQNTCGIWSLNISNPFLNTTIKCKFIIDASGRVAYLNKKHKGKKICYDKLVAITSVTKNKPCEKTNYTLIEATEMGWWYCADIPGNKMICSYFTDGDIYKQNSKIINNYFKHKLKETNHIKERCKVPSIISNICSASTYFSTQRHGLNWLAIGDAAMAYDPLSSSGILRALKEGTESGEIIHNYFTGDINSIDKFASTYDAKFKKYLLERSNYYNMEKRWPDSIFWKRRRHQQPLSIDSFN